MNTYGRLVAFVLCCLTFQSFNVLSILNPKTPAFNKFNIDPIRIEVSWTVHDYNLHTIPSLQLVVNPLASRQFSPISKEIFANLNALQFREKLYNNAKLTAKVISYDKQLIIAQKHSDKL